MVTYGPNFLPNPPKNLALTSRICLRQYNTDKKEYQIFLIYNEIQKGSVAKSYMTNGPLILFG
jgi:hypothetical protein